MSVVCMNLSKFTTMITVWLKVVAFAALLDQTISAPVVSLQSSDTLCFERSFTVPRGQHSQKYLSQCKNENKAKGILCGTTESSKAILVSLENHFYIDCDSLCAHHPRAMAQKMWKWSEDDACWNIPKPDQCKKPETIVKLKEIQRDICASNEPSSNTDEAAAPKPVVDTGEQDVGLQPPQDAETDETDPEAPAQPDEETNVVVDTADGVGVNEIETTDEEDTDEQAEDTEQDGADEETNEKEADLEKRPDKQDNKQDNEQDQDQEQGDQDGDEEEKEANNKEHDEQAEQEQEGAELTDRNASSNTTSTNETEQTEEIKVQEVVEVVTNTAVTGQLKSAQIEKIDHLLEFNESHHVKSFSFGVCEHHYPCKELKLENCEEAAGMLNATFLTGNPKNYEQGMPDHCFYYVKMNVVRYNHEFHATNGSVAAPKLCACKKSPKTATNETPPAAAAAAPAVVPNKGQGDQDDETEEMEQEAEYLEQTEDEDQKKHQVGTKAQPQAPVVLNMTKKNMTKHISDEDADQDDLDDVELDDIDLEDEAEDEADEDAEAEDKDNTDVNNPEDVDGANATETREDKQEEEEEEEEEKDDAAVKISVMHTIGTAMPDGNTSVSQTAETEGADVDEVEDVAGVGEDVAAAVGETEDIDPDVEDVEDVSQTNKTSPVDGDDTDVPKTEEPDKEEEPDEKEEKADEADEEEETVDKEEEADEEEEEEEEEEDDEEVGDPDKEEDVDKEVEVDEDEETKTDTDVDVETETEEPTDKEEAHEGAEADGADANKVKQEVDGDTDIEEEDADNDELRETTDAGTKADDEQEDLDIEMQDEEKDAGTDEKEEKEEETHADTEEEQEEEQKEEEETDADTEEVEEQKEEEETDADKEYEDVDPEATEAVTADGETEDPALDKPDETDTEEGNEEANEEGIEEANEEGVDKEEGHDDEETDTKEEQEQEQEQEQETDPDEEKQEEQVQEQEQDEQEERDTTKADGEVKDTEEDQELQGHSVSTDKNPGSDTEGQPEKASQCIDTIIPHSNSPAYERTCGNKTKAAGVQCGVGMASTALLVALENGYYNGCNGCAFHPKSPEKAWIWSDKGGDGCWHQSKQGVGGSDVCFTDENLAKIKIVRSSHCHHRGNPAGDVGDQGGGATLKQALTQLGDKNNNNNNGGGGHVDEGELDEQNMQENDEQDDQEQQQEQVQEDEEQEQEEQEQEQEEQEEQEHDKDQHDQDQYEQEREPEDQEERDVEEANDEPYQEGEPNRDEYGQLDTNEEEGVAEVPSDVVRTERNNYDTDSKQKQGDPVKPAAAVRLANIYDDDDEGGTSVSKSVLLLFCIVGIGAGVYYKKTVGRKDRLKRRNYGPR